MESLERKERAKQFGKLVIAGISFRQVVALCDHMIECELSDSDQRFPPQMCGVVVTYARNFVSGYGFGALPRRFSEFEDSEFLETHERIIEARHKIYAHRDVVAAEKMVFDDSSNFVPYQLTVEWTPEFIVYPVTPELPLAFLPFVKDLALYQSMRVHEHVTKIGRGLLVPGKKYLPHTRYTLGVDFP